MNPRTLISIAAAANEVLPLAAESASSNWQWRQINRMASDLLRALGEIENNDAYTDAIRREAGSQRSSLRPLQKQSCEEVERTANQPIEGRAA